MRKLAVFALLSVSASAQYAEFASTDDGQQVYFTTNLAQRGAPIGVFAESRAFRLNGRSFELFAERGSLARPDGGGSGDGVNSIQVSGDGQNVAFVLTNICPPGDPCRTTTVRGEVRGRDAQVLPGEPQRVLLSRSGEWALLVPPPFTLPGSPGQTPVQNTESTLINLVTKERRMTGMPATPNGLWSLASDGSVLARVTEAGAAPGTARVGIVKDGKLTPLPQVPGGVALLGMSDNAQTVLASRIDLPASGMPAMPVSPELVAFDVLRANVRTIHRLGHIGAYQLLGMSNNGTAALVATTGPDGPGPLLIADLAAGAVDVLALPGNETARNGTLSGFGNAAIVATNSGRILRITLASRRAVSVEELLPTTPWANFNQLPAPGALVELEPPVAGNIDWTGRIRLDGVPIAILGNNGRVLTAQIPWEVRTPGSVDLTVDYDTASPLIQQARTFVAPQSPRLLLTAPADARTVLSGLLIKGDFSGYVTATPKQGDIVQMYMTGLGAVRGEVHTGQPAPLNELRPIATDIHCRFTPFATDARLLFAGLAPGLVGVYQLTFQFGAEADPNVTLTGMECGLNGNQSYNFRFMSLSSPMQPVP